MNKFLDQIKAMKATIEEKTKRMNEIAAKSAEESRSMDTAEAEEFDTLKSEIKRLGDDISRIETLVELDKQTATAVKSVAPVDGAKAATLPQGAVTGVAVKSTEKLEPGIGFARIARVKALAQKNNMNILNVAQAVYPKDSVLHESLAKTAIAPASTIPSNTPSDPQWASTLVLEGGGYFADFVEYLRPRTVIGQIEGKLRRIPFNTPVLVQALGGTGHWVGEGQYKPMTKWGYTSTKLDLFKVASIAAATKESLERASISTDMLIRDELARAITATLDTTFVSADAATTVSPAGLLNGATGITSLMTGGDVAGIKCDIAAFMKSIISTGMTLQNAFWIMPETTAIDLSMATNLAGGAAFPTVTPMGGTLAGLPVITSSYVPVNSAGATVILAKGDEIFYADEGGVQVSMSDQASLIMSDDPETDKASTHLVSMFQTNSVAFLVERYIAWAKRRNSAVVYASVDWECPDV